MARLFDDGNTEYLLNNSPVLTAIPLTLSAWGYPDAAVTMALVGVYDASSDDYFQIQIGLEGAYESVASTHGVGGSGEAIGANATQNAWNHICGVFSANNSRDVFLDGGNKTNDNTNTTPATIDVTQIGARAWFGGRSHYCSGRLAEIGIWNVALSDAEVLALASRVSPTRIRPESLVAYWPLYGIGSPEPDYRGTYNMTLVNGPVQADHAPVQPPFGFDLGPAGIYTVTPPGIVRVPRPPAAYNTLMIY